MEQKVVFETRYKKPIYEGQEYVAVMKDGTVMKTVAHRKIKADPNIEERFLNMVGAKTYLKNKKGVTNPTVVQAAPIPVEAKPEPPKKSDAELNEERLLKLNPWKQLLEVKSKADFDAFLKRNKYTVSISGTYQIIVGNVSTTLVKWAFKVQGVKYCCGGMEIGSHDGFIAEGVTMESFKILCKYIASKSDEVLQENFTNFGLVSYVRNPGELGDASARLGMLYDASELMSKVTQFRNPNTKNLIDLYAINDNWYTNEDED